MLNNFRLVSRSYKFHNLEGIYFISFAVVDWLDVFTRRIYKDILIDSISYCQNNKGLCIYSWCIMTNHVHMIISSKGSESLPSIIRDLKKFTSVKLLQAIKDNPQESRREYFLEFFMKAGSLNSNNKKYQFWRQDNRPIELWSNKVIEQKINYIHNNPVKAGFVDQIEDYPYSSAISYSGKTGLIEIEVL